MQKIDSRRRRHHRHRRRHKSRQRQKSPKDTSETKDEIPSALRPPTPPQTQQPPSTGAIPKEKPKDEKESGEMASTNQGKQSTSGEIATGQAKVSFISKFYQLFSFSYL